MSSDQLKALQVFHADSVAGNRKFVESLTQGYLQRQNAYQMKMRTRHTSGKINPRRLHAYKTTKDIFRQLEVKAREKSHGLYLLVDWSGSMSGIAPFVVRQVSALSLFCKKAGIDFSVVSFTSGGYSNYGGVYGDKNDFDSRRVGLRNANSLNMIQWADSSMTEKQINESFRTMLLPSFSIDEIRNAIVGVDGDKELAAYLSKISFGGTPLSEATIAFNAHVRDRIKGAKVQSASVIIFSDGEGNGNAFTSSDDVEQASRKHGIDVRSANNNRRIVDKTTGRQYAQLTRDKYGLLSNSASEMTVPLTMLKEVCTNVMGVFLSESDAAICTSAINAFYRDYNASTRLKESASEEKMNSSAISKVPDVAGYDNMFFISTQRFYGKEIYQKLRNIMYGYNVEVGDDYFSNDDEENMRKSMKNVSEDSSPAKIARAFKKGSGSSSDVKRFAKMLMIEFCKDF